MSEVATPTAEEIKEQSKLAMASLFGDRPLNKPEPVSEVAEPPPVEPAPPAPPAPVATPPPAPPEKTEAQKQEELIRQAAEATGREVAERMKPAPAAPEPLSPPVSVVEMGKEDKADYEVLMKLAESDPAYAEKAAEFAEFTRKNYEYQDAWLAAHPGVDFDANAEEHTAWYEANQKITPDELKEARDELRITQIAERRMAPTLEKLNKREAEEAIQASVPVVAGVLTNNVAKLVELVDSSLVAHLKDDKGVLSIGEEARNRVIAADPIAAREIENAVAAIRPMIIELEKTAIPALNHRLDPARNQIHAQIDHFRKQAEADIMAKPVSERFVDGKPFMTMEAYQAELSRIAKATPVKERDAAISRYADSVSLVTIDDIEAKIVSHHAEEAKKIIADIEAAARRKYQPTAPGAQTPAGGIPPNAAANAGKPKSPVIGSQAVPVTTQAAAATQEKNLAQSAVKQMFG